MPKGSATPHRRFGENLTAARKAAGLTQEQFAARLKFKRTAPLSIWERGHRLPTPKTIVKLARELGCEPAVLMAGVESPYDRLRGHTASTEALIVRDEHRHMYEHYLKLSPEMQRRFAATFEDIVREREGQSRTDPRRRRAPKPRGLLEDLTEAPITGLRARRN